jgi:hypothetical protein
MYALISGLLCLDVSSSTEMEKRPCTAFSPPGWGEGGGGTEQNGRGSAMIVVLPSLAGVRGMKHGLHCKGRCKEHAST